MTPINILISLHKGYGLGDAVAMSAVLQHVVKQRPHWVIDYQAEMGKYQACRGIVANVFGYGKEYPTPHYDAEVQVILYETWAGWDDRPNTRVAGCLHERFGMGWDPTCGRYRVEVRPDSMEAARTLLFYGGGERVKRPNNIVAVHYEGDSAQDKKNLSNTTANDICRIVEGLDHKPMILDWRSRSPLSFHKITTPMGWGGNAEMVCAVIAHCKAFIGIDSGPSKCASATDTPSLVVWTKHHPAMYHDPAPNTTHLVPAGYHSMHPVCGDADVIAFFEANYNVRTYDSEKGLVDGVKMWLREVLR